MRTLRTLAALVLVLLAFEAAARWVEPQIPEPVTWNSPFTQAKYRQLQDIGEQGGADVVFVGSSIVNANVDAAAIGDALGATAYNAGLPSSNIPLWDEYLRTVVFDLACPSVVVIGVGLRDTNDNLPGYDNYVAAYRASLGRRQITGDLSLLERVESWASDVSVLVRLRPRLREPGNVVSWLRRQSAPGWTELDLDAAGRYRGFADNPYRGEEQLEALRTSAFLDYALGGRQVDALVSAAEAAREHGAAVMLMDLPAMESLLATALPPGTIAAYHDMIDELGARLGAPVFRAEDMNDNEEYYADLYHMNQAGTDALTARIIDWLADQDIPTEHGCG